MKEKLPHESAGLQKELNIMQAIASEQHPTRSDVITVQDKVSNITEYHISIVIFSYLNLLTD